MKGGLRQACLRQGGSAPTSAKATRTAKTTAKGVLHVRERLVEIGDKVFYVFDAAGEAD